MFALVQCRPDKRIKTSIEDVDALHKLENEENRSGRGSNSDFDMDEDDKESELAFERQDSSSSSNSEQSSDVMGMSRSFYGSEMDSISPRKTLSKETFDSQKFIRKLEEESNKQSQATEETNVNEKSKFKPSNYKNKTEESSDKESDYDHPKSIPTILINEKSENVIKIEKSASPEKRDNLKEQVARMMSNSSTPSDHLVNTMRRASDVNGVALSAFKKENNIESNSNENFLDPNKNGSGGKLFISLNSFQSSAENSHSSQWFQTHST